MLNQSNKYLNYILTYLDQGGNNIWWSSNNISNIQPVAQLLNTGLGIDIDCIDEECNPICSTIIESESLSIETQKEKQSLIFPTFSYNKDSLSIKLNNLILINQPIYLESDCVNNDCIDEFGIWTKAIKTNIEVNIENETYYFIRANPDTYGYGYTYKISLIHEETGEEIIITKDIGLIQNEIVWEQEVPLGFKACIYINKFNIEQVITCYKYIDAPLYLRSDWNKNLRWEPINNNTEEILLSVLYLINTDEEIYNKDELVLYKEKQESLIKLLFDSILNISIDNSSFHSYIKNSTIISDYKALVTDQQDILLGTSLGIYSTNKYTPTNQSNIVYILLLLIITKINIKGQYSLLLNDYITKCININTSSLKEEVLRILALTEAYKQTKDIYHLSIITTCIKDIKKLYKLADGKYIESLSNPILTIESKVFGDLLESYILNKSPNIKDYIIEDITYINDTAEQLYLLESPNTITNNPIHILILKLIGLNIPLILKEEYKLIHNTLKLPINNRLDGSILESYDLYQTIVFNDFKNNIPNDFKWLNNETPIQDLIIEAITKPLIDLYIHAKFLNDYYDQKNALVNNSSNTYISNIKELINKTITTNKILQNSLWPGKYSNSIDIEIKGYYDSDILNDINDNIKTLGISLNLISAVELPNISNFNLCFDVIKLEDYRCQVDIQGQLILLSDGQCNLAPPELPVLLQENSGPLTQQSSINDYILV